MYETWLRQYSSTSYALVLDTRDTFFQRDPSLLLRPFLLYNLRLRAAASSRPSLARVLRCRVYGVGAAHTPSHHRDALAASMAYELYHTLRRGSALRRDARSMRRGDGAETSTAPRGDGVEGRDAAHAPSCP